MAYVKGNYNTGMEELMKTMGIILDEYSNYIIDVTEEEIKSIAKEGSRTAKQAGEYRNRRPRYRKSIRSKTQRKDFMHPEGLIYASGHEYSLTHLLEHGHKLWNAPFRAGTRAFPHWVEADQLVAQELPKRLARRIESGV